MACGARGAEAPIEMRMKQPKKTACKTCDRGDEIKHKLIFHMPPKFQMFKAKMNLENGVYFFLISNHYVRQRYSTTDGTAMGCGQTKK